jgi:hypothetical protein
VEAGPRVLELFDGLKPGDALGSASVERIYAPRNGRIDLAIRMGQGTGSLSVALPGDGPLPPVTTEKYAVFWGNGSSPPPMPQDAMMQACEALAERIRKREKDVPPPVGLRSMGAIEKKM